MLHLYAQIFHFMHPFDSQIGSLIIKALGLTHFLLKSPDKVDLGGLKY